MEYQIVILTFASIFVFSSAILWDKPDVIEVNKENQIEFALPLGTKLFLDKRTQLYRPPPLASNFTTKDRMKLQWFNKKTRYNYCKIGATSEIEDWSKRFKQWFHSWCRDKDGEDMCCFNKKCSCNWFQGDCSCVTSKQFDYNEKRKIEDLQNYAYLADKAADMYFMTTPTLTAGEQETNVDRKNMQDEIKAAE